MKSKDLIRTAYAGVYETNDIAGNFDNVTPQSIDAQLGFCFEELSEAIEAFEKGDKAGFLKEICDMFVVTAGLLQKAEAVGYEVGTALIRVNDSNISKFPRIGQVFGNPNGYAVFKNDKYNRIVLKDEIGKFRKPTTYVEADVSDLVPKE